MLDLHWDLVILLEHIIGASHQSLEGLALCHAQLHEVAHQQKEVPWCHDSVLHLLGFPGLALSDAANDSVKDILLVQAGGRHVLGYLHQLEVPEIVESLTELLDEYVLVLRVFEVGLAQEGMGLDPL